MRDDSKLNAEYHDFMNTLNWGTLKMKAGIQF